MRVYKENIKNFGGLGSFSTSFFSVYSSSFGMLMPNRHSSGGDYDYGFQGELVDDEIKGEGNSVNYKYRMHDPRAGRFFAVDPLAAKYPHNSPYAFSENDVIACIELEGLEKVKTLEYNYNTKTFDKVDGIEINNMLTENVNRYIYRDPNGNITKEVYKSWSTDKTYTSNNGRAIPELLRANFGSDPTPGGSSAEPAPWYRKGLLGDWSGNHDSANLGGSGGSSEKEIKNGVLAISAIISIGTGGASLLMSESLSIGGTLFSISGIGSSIDDLSGLTSSDGKTFLENKLGSENAKTVKLILGFAGSKVDATNILNAANPTEKSLSIISFVNSQGQTYYGAVDLGKTKEANSKSEK